MSIKEHLDSLRSQLAANDEIQESRNAVLNQAAERLVQEINSIDGKYSAKIVDRARKSSKVPYGVTRAAVQLYRSNLAVELIEILFREDCVDHVPENVYYDFRRKTHLLPDLEAALAQLFLT